MQNDAGEFVDLYVPRKWWVFSYIYLDEGILLLTSRDVNDPVMGTVLSFNMEKDVQAFGFSGY